MRCWKLLLCLSLLALAGAGCGKGNQLATEAVYEAQVRVNAAETAGAEAHAPKALENAAHMLARAEEKLSAGKEDDAYRLGQRAVLMASVAEALAVANQTEAQLDRANRELAEKRNMVEAIYQALEEAQRELERLKATPE